MLSRVAESLFWMGRYMERADGTARILDVHLQLMLEYPTADQDAACQALLSIMGVNDVQGPLTSADVATRLATDKNEPASIAYSLVAARENGRRAREIISTELWECFNTTSIDLPTGVPPERHHSFFAWVKERSAMAAGIAYTTMNRDEPYQFFMLGQGLERADMTARLLATRDLAGTGGASWTTLLRSCGAYEACLRAYRGRPTAERAAEFLLLDKFFPRSIRFSVNRALGAVHELDPAPVSSRTGVATGAEWILGQAISLLQYQPIGDILANLPQAMDKVQESTSAASDAIKERYFPALTLPVWVGEAA
ncbi:MAG: alpha-E domain-containing protein [Bifidobacteriaceae bacterium]|nr:alpha-E domain-containing protein [Bifidobacteriaceae bacterium]